MADEADYSGSDSLLRHARTHDGGDGGDGGDGAPLGIGGTLAAAAMGTPRSPRSVPLSTLVQPQAQAQAAGLEPVATAAYVAYRAQQPGPELGARYQLELNPAVGPAMPGSHTATDFMGLSASIINTPTDLGYLELGLNDYEPAWLLGGNFDVDALNFSISAAIPNWGPPGTADALENQRLYAAENALNNLRTPSPSLEHVSRVQHKWHTKLSRAVTPQHSTGQLLDQELVDESYRDNLSNQLNPRMSDISLPSADFLVSGRLPNRYDLLALRRLNLTAL